MCGPRAWDCIILQIIKINEGPIKIAMLSTKGLSSYNHTASYAFRFQRARGEGSQLCAYKSEKEVDCVHTSHIKASYSCSNILACTKQYIGHNFPYVHISFVEENEKKSWYPPQRFLITTKKRKCNL